MGTNSEHVAAEAAVKIPPIVLMISGCMDSQTSADVQNTAHQFELPEDAGPGGAGGACTSSLAYVLDKSGGRKLSWVDLLRQMREKLDEESFTQVPQLSSSRNLSLSQEFDLLNWARPATSKVLLIGINYVGQRGELRGCHNDVEMMQRLLLTKGVPECNMRVLMDDGRSAPPTRDNILDGFEWLCADAVAGEGRFMHYSGHGGSIYDENSDEKDNKDETLVPVDYESAGQIVDDEIHERLILSMPKDVSLVCLMDCCHSGTILDLPYCVRMDDNTCQMVASGDMPAMKPNPDFDMDKLMGAAKMLFDHVKDDPQARATLISMLMRCISAILS